MIHRPENLFVLRYLLQIAQRKNFAIGAFSSRNVFVIRTVLMSAQKLNSPVIIQVAPPELDYYGMSLREFSQAFFGAIEKEKITIPVGLHLDHTWDFEVIKEAIIWGFTSVMIDASKLPLEENIRASRQVVEYAHARGVSVEAELGHVGAEDSIESQVDDGIFTDPDEVEIFVRKTEVDALAVSVGTSHGVYLNKKPMVDTTLIKQIRSKTDIPLVLHGGSGTPKEMVIRGIKVPEGGVSKINIATDLEAAFNHAIGVREHITNSMVVNLSESELKRGLDGVGATVEEKILEYLGSQGHAADYK